MVRFSSASASMNSRMASAASVARHVAVVLHGANICLEHGALDRDARGKRVAKDHQLFPLFVLGRDDLLEHRHLVHVARTVDEAVLEPWRGAMQ